MTRIPPERVRRDNSNIYACDDEHRTLYRALRKESGKNPDLTSNYHLFAPLVPTVNNPYPATDFRLDLEKFSERLTTTERDLFAMYLQGFTAGQISQHTHWSLKSVYRKIKEITDAFAEFYKEGE